MATQYYSKHKNPVLTDEEIKEKYKDIQEELQEVLEWEKETKATLEDSTASPQKKGAAKRAMKKVLRRIDTVRGQIIYWEFRIKGESHFKANIEKNEYWASCREKAEEEQKKIEEELTRDFPRMLLKKSPT